MLLAFLAALVTEAPSVFAITPSEMARAVSHFTGKQVGAADIRRVSCSRIDEEPTEASCHWQQRTAGKWHRYSSYIAGSGDGIQLIDEPSRDTAKRHH